MNEIVRDTCARCAVKHIAQARVLMNETKLGYPWHVYFALGHLAEAADELVQLMPEEAVRVREARLVIEAGLRENKLPETDWIALLRTVAEGGMLEEMDEATA